MEIIEESIIVKRVKLTDQEKEAIKTIASIKCEQSVCNKCPLSYLNYDYSECVRNQVLIVARNNNLISEVDYEKLIK